MLVSEDQRRSLTQLAIRKAIAATAGLPIEPQRRLVRSLVALAGFTPMLRRRVRNNMQLALGPDVPPRSETLYFRRLGWAWAVRCRHSIAASVQRRFRMR